MKQKLFLILMLFVFCIGQVIADDKVVTLTAESGFPSSYEDKTFKVNDVSFTSSGVMYNGKGTPSGYANKQLIQLRKSGSTAGTLSSSEVDGYDITSIKVYAQVKNEFSVSFDSNEGVACSTLSPNEESMTYSLAEGGTNTATAYVYTFNPESTAKTLTVTNGSKANYFFKIVITYTPSSPSSDELQSIVVSGTPTKTEYFVGDSFDPAGLTVKGTYTESGEKNITTGITWTCDPETFDELADATSVKVTAKVGTKKSNEYTVEGIKVIEKPSKLTVDFEESFSFYEDWNFSDGMSEKQSTITSHGGFYYGSTGGKTTCSITTKEKIATPQSITFYISKTSSNTTASNWNVKVSSDGTVWTMVGEGISATSMSKGEWVEVKRDLTEYSNVYVQISYGSSTAIRAIDDITLVTEAPKVAVPELDASCTFEESKVITIIEATEGAAIYYTVNDGEETPYSEPFTITATSTIEAYAMKGTDKSESVTATYTRTDFSSLEDLVNASLPSGTEVKVSFENVEITDIYLSGSYRNGVYVDVIGANNKNLEIYYNNVPETWIVGGKISGTMTCPWTYYEKGDVWELAPAKNSWNWSNLTYAAPSFNATISAAKYATLCLPFNFTVPEGVTAYTAEVNDEQNFVNITAIDENAVIPAGEGIIISGEAVTYTFTGSAATPSSLGDNDLVGVTEDTELEEGDYILALDGGVVKFCPIDLSDKVLAANKAYLKLSSSSPALGIRVNDGTGIRTIEAQAVNQYLDLMGRKVQNPECGIYILNGKKVYVK